MEQVNIAAGSFPLGYSGFPMQPAVGKQHNFPFMIRNRKTLVVLRGDEDTMVSAQSF